MMDDSLCEHTTAIVDAERHKMEHFENEWRKKNESAQQGFFELLPSG
jgi:hypothetical protein